MYVGSQRRKSSAQIAVLRPMDGRAFSFLLVVLLTTVLVLSLANTAQAAEVSATGMKVSVWPEYDDPRVLVIMQADLEPDTELPATVSFNVPKGAEVGMACEVNAAGSHACRPFRLEDKGDYQTLVYEITADRKVFFEYYYEAFPPGVGDRDFEFLFRPSFAAANLQLEVQEPARSSAFTLDPAFSQTSRDSEGLVYHLKSYQDVAVGEDIPVKISYTKSDADTSVKPNESEAGGPQGASGSGTNSTLFVVLGTLAFATLMFGGYKMFRPAPAAPARRGHGGRATALVRDRAGSHNRGTSARGAAARPASGGRRRGDTKFCTGCGSSLRIQDCFCPDCGEEQA
jgi:hypothetical protein